MISTGNMALKNLFERFMDSSTIFQNKKVLQPNHYPQKILHRQKQIEEIAKTLAPALKLERPSNIFVYGKPGTGKTLCTKHVGKELIEFSRHKKKPLKTLYINCKLRKVSDTEYRMLAYMISQLGFKVPATGLPTDDLYNTFFNLIDKQKQLILIFLDEIDQLVKKSGDDMLYNLTRINTELEKSQITIIGISNDLRFAELLDARVKSSLSEEETIFPPYNALELQDILHARAVKAFKPGTLEEGVIQKIAAIAAQGYGDARKAIELLRVSGEIAERENKRKVTLEHVDKAEQKIEHDTIIQTIKAQPKQSQAILYSMLLLDQTHSKAFVTGDVYDVYKNLCDRIGLRPLTQRRVSDMIAEFDVLGVITARVVSKGRYGRTRDITIGLNHRLKKELLKLLAKELGF